MFGTIFKWGAILVVCILVYNFFLGSNEEQEQSRKIFGEVRNVMVSVGQLVKSERNKFDAGKYDAALDKLGGAYKAIRDRAEYLDEKVIKRLDDLEQRKAKLDQDLNSIQQGDQTGTQAPTPKKGLKRDANAEAQQSAKAADQARRKAELQAEMDQLLEDSAKLLQEAQK
jgi:hypothetical protein